MAPKPLLHQPLTTTTTPTVGGYSRISARQTLTSCLQAVPVDSNTLDGAEFVKQASAKGATGAEGEATPTAESIPADWQQDDAAGSDDAEHTGTADAAEAAKSEEDAAADSGGGWGEDGDAAGTLVAEGLSEVAVPEPSAVSTHAPQKPPKRKGRMQMMELATAMAILAEPWDEEGERDRDLAPSFVENEDGSKQPLEGVVSLFLTGAHPLLGNAWDTGNARSERAPLACISCQAVRLLQL